MAARHRIAIGILLSLAIMCGPMGMLWCVNDVVLHLKLLIVGGAVVFVLLAWFALLPQKYFESYLVRSIAVVASMLLVLGGVLATLAALFYWFLTEHEHGQHIAAIPFAVAGFLAFCLAAVLFTKGTRG